MTNALQLFPDSVNQHVLFPEVYDCLRPSPIKMVDDIGARVENRVVTGCRELQVFVTGKLLVESKKAIMLPLFLLREGDLDGTVRGNLFCLIQKALRGEDVLVVSHVLSCYRTSCLIRDCTVRIDKSRHEGYKLTGSPAWYDCREISIIWHGGCKRNLYVLV